jgi:hypothetical protein
MIASLLHGYALHPRKFAGYDFQRKYYVLAA